MKRPGLILLCCALICLLSCSNSTDLILYKKDKILPYILIEDLQTEPAGKLFKQVFKRATGVDLEILKQERGFSGQPKITFRLDPSNSFSFVLKKEIEELSFEARYPNDLDQAIYYFFNQYVYTDRKYPSLLEETKQDSIIVPQGLSVNSQQAFAFQYREPYFPANQQLLFQQRFNTQSLETAWGLWGHNIGKFIHPSTEMYALIDGKRNPEQYDFSSPELEKALKLAIQKSLQEDPGKRLFMIMPNDNPLVCTCASCQELGNTSTNATPALMHLINQLALTFPEALFFSSDYLSSTAPETGSMPKNSGVIISTMDFPKGIVLRNSKFDTQVRERFEKWSSKTKNIYLWDYGVNFDNYMDAYPNLLVHQENLKFFHELGVTGVFMQGNENGYAAFENLKAAIYAQLFMDLNMDIPQAINSYFSYASPNMGKVLADYFILINRRALQSKNPLDIYGGIQQSFRKYLREEELLKFYNDLSLAIKDSNPLYQEQLFKLKLSVLFQLLEIARNKGLQNGGYGTYNLPQNQCVIKEETRSRLSILKDLVDLANVKVYNESEATFSHYLEQWEEIILKKPYQNLLIGQGLSIQSKLDEDYTDSQLLTDGALGFDDFQNNWMIFTQGDLKLEIPISDALRNAKTFEINFLVDRRHKLDLPQEITLQTDGSVKPQHQELAAEPMKLKRSSLSIPIRFSEKDKILTITIRPRKPYGFACDELILK